MAEEENNQHLDHNNKRTMVNPTSVSVVENAMSLLPPLAKLKNKIPVDYELQQTIVKQIDKVQQLILQFQEDEKPNTELSAFISLQSAFDFGKQGLLDAISWPSESTSSHLDYNKYPSMKNITGFCFTDSNAVHAILLSHASTQLKFLDVNWSHNSWREYQKTGSKMLGVLNDILISSQGTLTHLKIDAFNLFSDPIITASKEGFLNLRHLHLAHLLPRDIDITNEEKKNVDEDTDQKTRSNKLPIIPSGIKLVDVFPGLKTLVLEMPTVKFEKKSIKKFFPDDYFNFTMDLNNHIDSLSSVKNLALDCKFSMAGLKALGRKFPNVSAILVKNMKDVFINDDSVWFLPWEGLASLEIRGLAFGDRFFNRDLDSFFTGFSNEICNNLRKCDEKTVTVDPRVVKMFGSVRDLQNLRRLRVVFDHPSNAEWKCELPGDNPNLISHITGLYTFNLMSNLVEVTFAYDFNQPNSQDMAKVLKPLDPFVNFVHEPIQSAHPK